MRSGIPFALRTWQAINNKPRSPWDCFVSLSRNAEKMNGKASGGVVHVTKMEGRQWHLLTRERVRGHGVNCLPMSKYLLLCFMFCFTPLFLSMMTLLFTPREKCSRWWLAAPLRFCPPLFLDTRQSSMTPYALPFQDGEAVGPLRNFQGYRQCKQQ